MAKLSKCRICSHTVSIRAKHCPSCGEGKPGSKKIGRKTVVMLMLVSMAFAGGMNGNRLIAKLTRHVNEWSDQVADYKVKALAEIQPAAGGQ